MASAIAARTMTKMKKIKSNQILIGVTILSLAVTTAFGSDSPASESVGKYRAMETSLDIFGTGSIDQETINHLNGFRYKQDVELGAGVGVNHFITRNFGLGAEAYSESTSRHFIDNASGNLILRFPIGETGLAPYAYVGGGREFDPIELWFGQVGAGLEFRFTPKWGTFADARYVITDGAKDHGLVRVGLRLVF